MRAFTIDRPGGTPALTERPKPVPGPGEVLVRIAAAGLNFADLLIAKGTYQDLPDYPATLGLELAGTVEALGPETQGPAPGTRVAVYAGSGGLAEWGVFPADRCVVVPDVMSLTEAAGFQIAYGTSHLALSHRAHLAAGETLVVLGAGGGVGLTAVEVGAAMGARVIAVARGPDKLSAAEAAGATALIDSAEGDLKGRLRALGGADVIYDPVGGDQFQAALSATRPEGRILLIGFASGTVPPIRANHLLVKNVSVIGLYWGGYLKFRPEALTESLEILFGWHAAGRLKPRVGHVLPLAEADAALELLRSRKATGKVIVAIGPDA